MITISSVTGFPSPVFVAADELTASVGAAVSTPVLGFPVPVVISFLLVLARTLCWAQLIILSQTRIGHDDYLNNKPN
jgi:hypothetical protein